MTSKRYQLTQDGLKNLKSEQAKLQKRRQEIAVTISEAREQGDLRENSEYQMAKEEQDRNSNRLIEIDEILHNFDLISRQTDNQKVYLGATIALTNQTKRQQVSYSLVGTLEANPAAGKISDESPLGQALLDKSVGEVVTVGRNSQQTSYRIDSISSG